MIQPATNFGTIDIQAFWSDYLDLYDVDMFDDLSKWFADEDIEGVSCKQYRLYNHHLAFILALEIYKYHMYNPTLTWDEVSTYYDVQAKSNYLAKYDISLTKVLNIFNLPF